MERLCRFCYLMQEFDKNESPSLYCVVGLCREDKTAEKCKLFFPFNQNPIEEV